MPAQLSPPTPADVARIAAHPDPVLRNLLITQGYHELAVAARAHLGHDANWCAFATWASRQAGRTIRREDLRAALRLQLCASPQLERLGAALRAALPGADPVAGVAGLVELVLRALDADAAFARAAEAVAAGNRKVFEEIGAHMARFLDALPVDEPARFAAFLEPLRRGDPPDGQQHLRDAFSAYREAMATAPEERAQLVFCGNLLIGLHEQVRLQPEILAAMNCAFDAEAVRRRLVARLVPGFWRALRYRIASRFGLRPPLDELLDRLLVLVQRELREVITANAMTLELPTAITVRLGRDVSGPYPAALARLTEPRLARLLATLDPAPDTAAGSRALDWGVLEQRLHHIAELFRCRHEWAPLFDPPYSPAQVEALRAGTLPAPPL